MAATSSVVYLGISTVHSVIPPITFTLQVVPTEFYSRLGYVTETHQYSVSEYAMPLVDDGRHTAMLDLLYDLSPIVVTINEKPPSILHFFVRMSAVVGGVFAMTRKYLAALLEYVSECLHAVQYHSIVVHVTKA